jgi:hypothetical protein
MPAPGSGSYTNIGPVHAMLLRAGRGLTSAFVYTEALPENVIAAKLRWRQGNGAWQELTDDSESSRSRCGWGRSARLVERASRPFL